MFCRSSFFFLFVFLFSFPGAVQAREAIRMVGSSTVFPYAQMVAERFGEAFPHFKTPVVESGGSGAGIKEFCKGTGPLTVDIVNSSRPFFEKELEACHKAGVHHIGQVMFGFDALVIAGGPEIQGFSVLPEDVYRALAARVPVRGEFVENPYMNWKDVNSSLPGYEIRMYLPGMKHGSRNSFEDILLFEGCRRSGAIALAESAGMTAPQREAVCKTVRNDGKVIDIDGDSTETFGRLSSEKFAFGVFSLSFYENNADRLTALGINGVFPSVSTVISREYFLARPLFFYVKKDHFSFIPGLREYVRFFLDEAMAGPEGLLAEYGLAPVSEAQRKVRNVDLM